METMSQKVVTPEGKTRLMITKMILENFKSYAGAQEIGPFHKRFSSVVGPNGSGKSNVIDALLFVFGKRAKQLRLNKVSELIHKSSGFPNLEYARVAVHFQLIYDDEESADDFEIVPGSEFIVSRTADLKNQSKYTVDGKGSTYTEVGLLLRKHGIDLDNNRFLILQGEVEQIAMMKPKAQNEHEEGLLEYLEDIIGSNKFAERIEEAGKALEILNEKRVEKVNRLRSADKEREELVEEKDKVEKRRLQEQQIRERQNVLYQLEESLALSKVKHYVVEKEKAQALLELESAKKKEGEEELLSLEKAYSSKKAEYDSVKKELDNAQANFAAYERKDTELQENITHSRVQMDKFKSAVSRDLRKEEECLREAEDDLQQVTVARAKLAETEANKVAEEVLLEGILEGLKEATQGLRDNLEGAQAQLADAERATATIQTEKESAETGLQLLRARSTAAVLAVTATEEKIKASEEEVENLIEKKAALEAEKGTMERRVKVLESQAIKAQDEETVLHSNLKQSLTSLEDAKASLLAQQNTSGKGKNKVLDMLMAATKKGGPLQNVGLRGRLGDLGTIDPEFDVAISTCCGMLDYMVVDTVVGGQLCINYIRENNIGRANFLVLEQTGQHRGGMERFLAVKVPEGAKRLIDLVTPSDPSLQLVFYMAVRDTLVSKDLESAVAIAYQGGKAMWRVVCTDGNLIDISGSMSGGGKSAKSGGMLLSGASTVRVNAADTDQIVTPEQVSNLEGKVAQCEAALATCRLNRKNASASAKESATRVKAIEIELEKLDLEMNRVKGQVEILISRLKVLQKDVKLSPAEIKDMEVLEIRITKLDEDIAKASPDKVTLKRSVEAIKRQIKAEGGPKLARAQAKVDSLAAQLQILNKTTSTKEVEEKTHRKQAMKVAESRAKGEMELSKATAKLAAYQSELAEMEEDAITLIQAQEAAVHSEVIQGEQLHTLDASHTALQKSIKKLRETETKLTDEFEKAEYQLKSKSSEAAAWRQKLESVRAEHTEEQTDYNADVNEVLASLRKNIESSGSCPGAASVVEEEQTIELLPDLTPENLVSEKDDLEEIKREIEILEKARSRQASGDRSALMDWIKKDRLYRLKLSELEAVTLERNTVRKEYESLRGQRLEMFMGGFGIITLKLKEMYQMITLGGDAELELLDSLDPFSEGIVFSVRPPKKSWKNISNLSGGEKTLSSLALVFALHHYKPTPLYVMDEIDAALDFKNVSIVANYIKERTKNAQFVIISLRNNMFELADRLVGIYKTHDATKSVTINPRMFAEATTNKSKLLASAGKEKEKEKKSGDGERGKVVLGDATNRMT